MVTILSPMHYAARLYVYKDLSGSQFYPQRGPSDGTGERAVYCNKVFRKTSNKPLRCRWRGWEVEGVEVQGVEDVGVENVGVEVQGVGVVKVEGGGWKRRGVGGWGEGQVVSLGATARHMSDTEGN